MHARSIASAFFCILTAHAAHSQATPAGSIGSVGWYNGDRQDGIPGEANWYISDRQFARTFDDFTVPGGGWTIAGLFSLNTMSVSGVTEAFWEIRSGVSTGNGGTVVTSGRSPATQSLLYSLPDGENVYRVEVDGLGVQLAPGTYWLNVSPVVSPNALIASSAPSYMCPTIGANAVGNPPGNDGNAFFYSPASPQGFFQPVRNTGALGTSGDFSQGVLISPGPAAAPSITAVVSAADWQGGAVSPGELVAITGDALGPAATSTLLLDQNGKVATSLEGVQVLFSGIAAPEIYVSASQINAIVPYELAGVANPYLQIRSAGQTSGAFALKLASATPAIFTANGSGDGPAAALNQDYSYNTPGHPAAAGTYVVLYITGEGLTTSPVTGQITTASAVPPVTPQPLLTPVTALIGGQPAGVGFSGEAPGLVSGVLQINVLIPSNAPPGDLPVSVSLGGVTTQNGVTISVR